MTSIMEYAAYILGLLALLLCFILYRRRQILKARREHEQLRTLRIFEPSSDPLENRIEFHIRKK